LPSEPSRLAGTQGVEMKTEAFRAMLTLAEPVREMTAGTTLRLQVIVRNTSSETWPGKDASGKLAVRLGNHWRNANVH